MAEECSHRKTIRSCVLLGLRGWRLEGPFFKDADHYLSSDGANPEAPAPGYGWPLGTTCWWFLLRGHGLRLCATGLTKEKALSRALKIAQAEDPAREGGAVQ